MAKKLKPFTVYAIVEMDVAIDIEASDLTDALKKSEELEETDFCKPLGEYSDSAMKIRGVYDSNIHLTHDR